MNRCLILCLLLTFVATCVLAQSYLGKLTALKVPPVDRMCLDCLCEATSNCNETLKCRHYGMNTYLCGAYVISWAYWHDSGKPGDRGGVRDFESCLNSMACAEASVRGYMRKYGKDCDGNGEINCDDYVRIHKLGFNACGGDEIKNTEYWKRYDRCYNGDLLNGDNSHFGEYDFGENGNGI